MQELQTIQENLKASIQLKTDILNDSGILAQIQEISSLLVERLKAGHKILLCGNGGSAADAQHIAAEFSGRYNYDRPPLFAEALHVNTSYLTAVANDYSFDVVYSRMVQAMGKENDILIGLSTSGNSKNIIHALKTANSIGMTTIGFTGETGGDMGSTCDLILKIPSKITPRIQECHLLIGHIICEIVESQIFPNGK